MTGAHDLVRVSAVARKYDYMLWAGILTCNARIQSYLSLEAAIFGQGAKL